GRVFPAEMKAAPLLRRWLQRLRAAGVVFHSRHRWIGWDEAGALRFATAGGEISVPAGVVVLATGGASWPRLGSDGAWAPLLAGRGIAVAPLVPANCGFDAAWSEPFAERFAGHPLRTVAMSPDANAAPAQRHWTRGEAVVTATGIEGSLVYAIAPPLREALPPSWSTCCPIAARPSSPNCSPGRPVASRSPTGCVLGCDSTASRRGCCVKGPAPRTCRIRRGSPPASRPCR